MLKFIIYETENVQTEYIQEVIKEYAEQQYTSIKVFSTNNIDDLSKLKGKICLIDYDAYLKSEEKLKEWEKINKIIFIFIAKDYVQMIEAVKRKDLDAYCLLDPLKKEMLILLLDYIRQKIKSHIIAIKKAHNGEEIIEVNKLNYVNIVHRSLRFYMVCKREINSQTLRQSFAKEIKPMLKHSELYFMAPSMLVNLENIKELYPDHMIFKNQEIAYYPKTQYEKLREAWFNFYEI